MAKLLLDHGAEPDRTNACPGWTPLHFAAYEGHADMVRLLVEYDAVPDAKDKQGETPETWAVEWENYKCAMILADATREKCREREEKEAKRKAKEGNSAESKNAAKKDTKTVQAPKEPEKLSAEKMFWLIGFLGS